MSIRLVTRSVWSNPGNAGRRLRRSCAAVGWQLRKRLIGRPRLLRLANGVRFCAYPDCVVSSALIYADWPEFMELMFLRRFLRPGELVLDVGANVGHISLLLADVVGAENLVCFEPTPVSYRRLTENWRLNGWPTELLLQAAAGAEEGMVRIPDVDRPVTTNSITAASAAPGSVEVRLVRLDDVRNTLPEKRIGLLKIDVEGHEPSVFRGARRMLSADRPRLVMFECLHGEVPAELRELFEDARYRLFQLDDSGRPEFSRLTAQNLFAIPDEESLDAVEAADAANH